jgi:hypothetical protein
MFSFRVIPQNLEELERHSIVTVGEFHNDVVTQQIGKDAKGSILVQTEELPQHFPGGTKVNHTGETGRPLAVQLSEHRHNLREGLL